MLDNIFQYIIYIYTHKQPSWQVPFFFPYKSNSFPNLLSDVRWPFLFTETNSFSVHQEFSRRNMAMKPVKYYVVLCVCFIILYVCVVYLWMKVWVAIGRWTRSLTQLSRGTQQWCVSQRKIREPRSGYKWWQPSSTSLPRVTWLTSLSPTRPILSSVLDGSLLLLRYVLSFPYMTEEAIIYRKGDIFIWEF